MKSKFILLALGLSASLILLAQDSLQVTVTLPKHSFLPGEPVAAHVIVTNTSREDITFIGKLPTNGLRVTAQITDLSGYVHRCGMTGSGLLVLQDPDAHPPKSTLAPGQSVAGDYPADLAFCPLTEFPPGRYILHVDVVKLPEFGTEPWPRIATVNEPIEVLAPVGEDLAYLNALRQAIATADPKTLKGGTLQDRPLMWGEILQTMRASAPTICLTKFPTSTYAGYALAHSAPTLTTMESLACLNDVDAALRRYGNRGGGEANTQGHILEAQNEMRAYAKAAGAFLGAHPDFVYAPLIRRMYAMCLGLTGHMPGAMAEIQALSTGSGKEAAEAQAFLAEKASAKPKS